MCPLVGTWVLYIHIDPICGRTTDIDMVLISSQFPDIYMPLSDNIGHSDQISMAQAAADHTHIYIP